MDPEEYEIKVAAYFAARGYATTRTSLTNDSGVDVFAEKNGEKIAIQAKMYGGTSRKVNRQAIMELHGAKTYFDCTKALLVTNGDVLSTAEVVAAKLDIEIFRLGFNDDGPREQSERTPFDHIWRTYIVPLKGKTLGRDDGKTNTILEVDSSGITRRTSNGKVQRIDIEIFRRTIEHIFREGRITRDEINQEYAKRASSGIVLILSQVPLFDLSTRPVALSLKKEEGQ